MYVRYKSFVGHIICSIFSYSVAYLFNLLIVFHKEKGFDSDEV